MRAAVVLLPLLLAPAAAGAHEVLHELVPGHAAGLRVFESDGEPLADRAYELWSPSDVRAPWQTGRTDRAGWIAFVPDVAGGWRVKVVVPGGHGLDTTVQVGGAQAAPSGRPAAGAGFALRPLVGAAVIVAIFAALFAWQRRRGARP
jgi:nickel transport protein